MSNKYINAAINQARSIKDPSAAHILLVLANRADPHGVCFPPHESIAADTGYSLATVKRKLTLLKRQGRVHWTTVRNSQGQNIGNRYRLTPATAQGELWTTAHPVPKTAPATAHPVPEPQLTVSCENPLRETINRKRNPRERENAPSALAPNVVPFSKPDESGRPKEARPASKKDRAHPLPSEWAPSQSDVSYGVGLGLAMHEIFECIEAIRLWAQANGARKCDWSAAFKGWMRREAKGGYRARPHEKGYAELADDIRNGGEL